MAGGDADFAWLMPLDEWDAISINYTSGTTGKKEWSLLPLAYLLVTAGKYADNIGGKACRLFMDIADVSLQWLVFPHGPYRHHHWYICVLTAGRWDDLDALATHNVTHLVARQSSCH